MAYAVVNHVRISDSAAARSALQSEVIPRVRQMDGFVKGYWTSDESGTTGMAMLIFDTRAQAEAFAERIQSGQLPPPSGVIFERQEVREVVGEA